MSTPSTVIHALQTILGSQSPAEKPNKKIEAFHSELERQTFRPLPKKFDTLFITAALGRWSDLKKPAKDQLTNDIIERWQNFEHEQAEKPPQPLEPETTPPESVSPIEETKDTALNQQTSSPTTPAIKTPASYTAPKRDWFDLITDCVAIFFKPLYDSE